jgi:hypothetical protein
MKEETATELMASIERAFQALADATGGKITSKSLVDTMKVGAMVAAALNPAHKQKASVVAKRGMKGYLLTLPEPSSIEEKERLKTLLLNFPCLIRQPLIGIAKQFPYERRGQAPAFGGNPQTEKAAVEDVGMLMSSNGDALHEALNTIANRYGISSRTMRRAWNRHKARIKSGKRV